MSGRATIFLADYPLYTGKPEDTSILGGSADRSAALLAVAQRRGDQRDFGSQTDSLGDDREALFGQATDPSR
jgi:hypothetical protein